MPKTNLFHALKHGSLIQNLKSNSPFQLFLSLLLIALFDDEVDQISVGEHAHVAKRDKEKEYEKDNYR